MQVMMPPAIPDLFSVTSRVTVYGNSLLILDGILITRLRKYKHNCARTFSRANLIHFYYFGTVEGRKEGRERIITLKLK